MDERSHIPKFLTNEYLEKILSKDHPGIKVKSFSAKPPVAAGNNYASLILRVTIDCVLDGAKLVKSVILKTLVVNEDSAKIIEEFGAHNNEMTNYHRVLPKFQELLKSIGDTDQLCARAIAVDYETKSLIFEDLKERSFSIADRKTGLNWEQLELAVKKLAKLHACSVGLEEREGETYKEFRKGLFPEDLDSFNSFFNNMLDEVAHQVKTWKGYEQYAIKLEALNEKVIEKGKNIYKNKAYESKVLNHGDAWVANMMFRNDGNKNPVDVVLIDFQMPYYGSCVQDLIYLFNTSASDDIKFDEMNFYKLVRIYLETLTNTMHRLDCKRQPPSLFQLHLEVQERYFYEFIVVCTIFPVIINEKEHGDIQTLIGDSPEAKNFRRQLVENKRFHDNMKHFLPIWDAKGIIE